MSSVLMRSELFERHGATAVFSLRGSGNLGYGLSEGDAHVDRNLERFVKASGLSGVPHQARQEHGADVLVCSGGGAMHAQEADILIAQGAACPVGVRVADCLPVLLADPEAGVVAAAHAGWRGTVKNVAGVAVAAMRERGARPERIIAAVGPCIGPCCFEIGEEVADQLAGCCKGAAAYVRNGRADLTAINIRQLQQAGMTRDRIEHLGGCTCCEPERFFSYRRDGGESGRHLAVAVLERRP